MFGNGLPNYTGIHRVIMYTSPKIDYSKPVDQPVW